MHRSHRSFIHPALASCGAYVPRTLLCRVVPLATVHALVDRSEGDVNESADLIIHRDDFALRCHQTGQLHKTYKDDCSRPRRRCTGCWAWAEGSW